MLSRKLVKKLADKKYRTETGLFIVEGKKSIFELLESDFVVEAVYGTTFFMNELHTTFSTEKRLGSASIPEFITVSEDDVVDIGTLKTNNAGIAVAQMRTPLEIDTIVETTRKEIVLILDDIRDPGNLGTIIRTADWFGVTHIVASETTTDFYNPKTIAATMGSFSHITVSYFPLERFLERIQALGVPVIGATLDGKNISETTPLHNGALLMGSESHGINSVLTPFITEKVTIPRFGNAESLNVGIATGILLSTLKK